MKWGSSRLVGGLLTFYLFTAALTFRQVSMSVHHLEQLLNVLHLALSIVLFVLVKFSNLLATHFHENLIGLFHLKNLSWSGSVDGLDLETVV